MAAAVAQQQLDPELGETSPLIANQQPEQEKPLQPIGSSLAEKAVGGAAAVSFTASILSMLLVKNPIVYVSGVIGAVISPYAAIQQQKITQVNALAETNQRGKLGR